MAPNPFANESEDQDEERPLEITLTDLRAGRARRPERGTDAAGTPGGGTAAGGLAGTNIDDGSPENCDLDDALGSGLYDTEGEDDEDFEQERGWRKRKRLTE